jgi:uncharacterized protein
VTTDLDAGAIIDCMDLAPHPEGGWFRETWRDEASTAIYFLLRAGERSRWHRLHGSSEIWHHYLGDALTLLVSADGLAVEAAMLGADLGAGEQPQLVVPTGAWQSAEPVVGRPCGYTLAGCTVSPPFRIDAFELAPTGWEPG